MRDGLGHYCRSIGHSNLDLQGIGASGKTPEADGVVQVLSVGSYSSTIDIKGFCVGSSLEGVYGAAGRIFESSGYTGDLARIGSVNTAQTIAAAIADRTRIPFTACGNCG